VLDGGEKKYLCFLQVTCFVLAHFGALAADLASFLPEASQEGNPSFLENHYY